jgi:predicted small lipoprotein YifL
MRALVALGLMTSLFLSGCGKKGDLRAPELATPKVIENLRATSVPNGVALAWSRPTEYVDGRELKDLMGFVIFRKDISPTCVDCPVPYRPLTTVDLEDREKFVKQKQYRYVDEEVQQKMIYRYRVASQLKDGSLSEPSNEVEIARGP